MGKTALLLVDVQQGLDEQRWGERNNPQAEENIARLLKRWREQVHPVIHVKHNSLEANSPLRPEARGNAFKPEAAPLPAEPIFEKTVNSGFIGTNLESYLREQGITDLVIVGLTTDHCVSTTTRMAGNLGFDISLVSDATATFDRTGTDGNYYSAETMHQVNLASLHGEFCQVVTTNQLLKQSA